MMQARGVHRASILSAMAAMWAMKARIAATSLSSGFAAPLVHEEFLEFERDRAAAPRIALMDEARLFALALKGDVFAHVEPATVEVKRCAWHPSTDRRATPIARAAWRRCRC